MVIKMKVVLQNGEELNVTRINRTLVAEGNEQMMITFPRTTDIEEIKEKMTNENISPSFVLKREGNEDKSYEGYLFQSAMEDVAEDSTNVTVTLIK